MKKIVISDESKKVIKRSGLMTTMQVDLAILVQRLLDKNKWKKKDLAKKLNVDKDWVKRLLTSDLDIDLNTIFDVFIAFEEKPFLTTTNHWRNTLDDIYRKGLEKDDGD